MRQPVAPSRGAPSLFDAYAPLPGTWDELFAAPGVARSGLGEPLAALMAVRSDELARAQALAERALLTQGVTFSVYSDDRGSEKIW